LRRTQTSAEDLLWRELRDRRLDGWKFRRQMPIAGHVVDFACVTAKLAIEVDGKHHAEQLAEDAERRDKIGAAGYLEIRFTNDDVRGRPHWVIEEIRRMLDLARGVPMRKTVFRMD
jgi:very-short-patch-repair endonuclease